MEVWGPLEEEEGEEEGVLERRCLTHTHTANATAMMDKANNRAVSKTMTAMIPLGMVAVQKKRSKNEETVNINIFDIKYISSTHPSTKISVQVYVPAKIIHREK